MEIICKLCYFDYKTYYGRFENIAAQSNQTESILHNDQVAENIIDNFRETATWEDSIENQ